MAVTWPKYSKAFLVLISWLGQPFDKKCAINEILWHCPNIQSASKYFVWAKIAIDVKLAFEVYFSLFQYFGLVQIYTNNLIISSKCSSISVEDIIYAVHLICGCFVLSNFRFESLNLQICLGYFLFHWFDSILIFAMFFC